MPSARPAVEGEEHYRDASWRRCADATVAAGRTLEGPHRSDLHCPARPQGHAGREMFDRRAEGAVARHRSGACPSGGRSAGGRTPLVLLDEVAAHLDESRRLALFDLLDRLGCQAWVTGTDDAVFAPLGAAGGTLPCLHHGTVTPMHGKTEHPGADRSKLGPWSRQS